MKTLISVIFILLSFVATTAHAQTPQFARVFIVAEENANYSSVSAAAPCRT